MPKHGVIVRVTTETLKKIMTGKVTMKLPKGEIVDMRFVHECDSFDLKIHGDTLPEVKPGHPYSIWDCECREGIY